MGIRIGDKFIWLHEGIEYTVLDIDRSRCSEDGQILSSWIRPKDFTECSGWYNTYDNIVHRIKCGDIVVISGSIEPHKSIDNFKFV